MKAVNKISQVLAVLFSAAAVIFFFLPFATVAFGGKDYTFIGAQFAFGTGIEGIKDSLAKSGQVLFCFILALLTLVFSGLTFKFKKMMIVTINLKRYCVQILVYLKLSVCFLISFTY